MISEEYNMTCLWCISRVYLESGAWGKAKCTLSNFMISPEFWWALNIKIVQYINKLSKSKIVDKQKKKGHIAPHGHI